MVALCNVNVAKITKKLQSCMSINRFCVYFNTLCHRNFMVDSKEVVSWWHEKGIIVACRDGHSVLPTACFYLYVGYSRWLY